MSYTVSIDAGGTFTDIAVACPDGRILIDKSDTVPERMFDAGRIALSRIATRLDTDFERLMAETELVFYGTTRATNAIVETTTAPTAFFTTAGHPDILTLREGGKLEPFNLRTPYPGPYVPRSLTFELGGRIDAQGAEVAPLDEVSVRFAVETAKETGAEAIGVCLLWSFANPAHELRTRDLIHEAWPGVPVTLSHELNPTIREYRRASSTVIDASLKPLMQTHFRKIAEDLEEVGFTGELLMTTSHGGSLHAGDIIERPIYSVGSGPSLAPVAARECANRTSRTDNLVVCDAGGTTFDVSVIVGDTISTTREMWLGPQFEGHITGLSSVAVNSLGAGGGSIAWIDSGGLLRVGPRSAGAHPGPVCYGRGGSRPTVTDAAAVLGYFDPDFFLGGLMSLDVDAAREAIRTVVAEPLGIDLQEAAGAILAIANQAMIGSIREITINEGIDPRECMLVAGGGAGGLSAVEIARELGCPQILVPSTAGALSATGALHSDVIVEFTVPRLTKSGTFEIEEINSALAELDARMDEFATHLPSELVARANREYATDAHYPGQVWELRIPLDVQRLGGTADVTALVDGFHAAHLRTYSVNEPTQEVDFLSWSGRLTIPLEGVADTVPRTDKTTPKETTRPAWFPGLGWSDVPCLRGESLPAGFSVDGPGIIEDPVTTVVLPADTRMTVQSDGSYLIKTGGDHA